MNWSAFSTTDSRMSIVSTVLRDFENYLHQKFFQLNTSNSEVLHSHLKWKCLHFCLAFAQ